MPSKPAAQIPRWRSKLRDSTIIAVDGKPTDTILQVESMISDARKREDIAVTFTLATLERVNVRPDTNVPKIHFDQLNVMSYQHHAARTNTAPWKDPHNLPPVDDTMVHAAIARAAETSVDTRIY